MIVLRRSLAIKNLFLTKSCTLSNANNLSRDFQQRRHLRGGRQTVGGGRSDEIKYDVTAGTEMAGAELPDENVPGDTGPGSGRKGRVNVRKMLKHSATFEEIAGDEPLGDPFISGPYTKGTKVPEDVRLEDQEGEEATAIPKIDPRTKTVITFPGDGTQYVGMCGDPDKFPPHIKILYEIASNTLKYDLLDLCMNGPKEKLSQTRYAQPAILVSSLAALENLRDRDPQAVENCIATAGFSVGEVAALVFAGSLTYEDAVEFVKYRGEAMQLAGEMIPGGMSLVFYGADSKLGEAMQYAQEWCRREYHIEYPVCSIANFLFPHCKIIAGNKEALDFIELNYKDFKLRKVKRLPAAAAYHTELMRQAAEPLKVYLQDLSIKQPRIQVYSNATGNNYYTTKQIRTFLAKQVYMGVKWEQILHAAYSRPQKTGFPQTYECGPGESLGPIFRMVNRKAHNFFESISPGDVKRQ